MSCGNGMLARVKSTYLLYKYGITLDMYEALYTKAGLRLSNQEKAERKLTYLQKLAEPALYAQGENAVSLIPCLALQEEVVIVKGVSYNWQSGRPVDLSLNLFRVKGSSGAPVAQLFASFSYPGEEGRENPERFSALIEDIVGQPNKGYGSCLMNVFLTQCRAMGMRTVKGTLSDVDGDHRDRQVHFYQKHGFTIKGNVIKISLL